MNDLIANHPRPVLKSKTRRNCIVTRSMLTLGWNGLDEYCHAHFFSKRDWLKLHFIAAGSVAKNGIRLAPGNQLFHHVFNTWSTGYFHWLGEVAIKFLLFESQLRDGVILLPPNAPNFITDFLEMFRFGNVLEVQKTIFVNKLALYQNPYHGHHLPSHLELLKNRVFAEIGITNPVGKRNLYISRENAQHRRVANEPEVIDFLTSRDFEVIRPESLSFAEQVKAFSECGQLVSIHGAGLSNSIFMPKGSSLIEFYPHEGNDHNFRRMNLAIGNKHEYLYCEIANPDSTDLRMRQDVQKYNDLIVDVKDLEDRLK